MATNFEDLDAPDSSVENYLGVMAGQPEAEPPLTPQSRVEKYLDYFLGHGAAGSVKDVYFLAGHIYEDEEMTKEITPEEGRIYYAINANMMYAYVNGAFKSIAGGAMNPSKVYNTYSAMVNALNRMTRDDLIVGSNIWIRAVNVPDLWVSVIETDYVEYIYTSDADFLALMEEQQYVKVGYFLVSKLEAGASLENYYTKAECNALFLKLADAYTKDQIDALLLTKADLVEGKVPASQLPTPPQIVYH